MEQEKGKTFIVYITGASGNIACNFLPLLANGLVFGPDVKLELRLFDIEPALDGLKGVMYELEDCCYELVQSIKIGSNAEELMKDADVAIFIGGVPQGKDHKGRASLLVKNGPIFRDQGRILNKVANKNVKCVVVANPTNTNCLILKENAPDIPPQNFTCMTRLDYNRVVNNLSKKLELEKEEIRKVAVWGNHSQTYYPDLSFAEYKGKKLTDLITDKQYLEKEMPEQVRHRNYLISDLRGHSTIISAANELKDHLRDWYLGTRDWSILGIYTTGKEFDIPAGLIFSMPVRCKNFEYEPCTELQLLPETVEKIKENVQELEKEKETAKDFLN